MRHPDCTPWRDASYSSLGGVEGDKKYSYREFNLIPCKPVFANNPLRPGEWPVPCVTIMSNIWHTGMFSLIITVYVARPAGACHMCHEFRLNNSFMNNIQLSSFSHSMDKTIRIYVVMYLSLGWMSKQNQEILFRVQVDIGTRHLLLLVGHTMSQQERWVRSWTFARTGNSLYISSMEPLTWVFNSALARVRLAPWLTSHAAQDRSLHSTLQSAVSAWSDQTRDCWIRSQQQHVSIDRLRIITLSSHIYTWRGHQTWTNVSKGEV